MKLTITILLATLATVTTSCPWGNEPVCGVNNITYANQCALASAYVAELHVGTCTKKVVVTE